jgi:CheY-like chemotaxis protein
MALRILIADDDRDTAAMLQAILEDEGHVVHAVHDGADVVRTAHMVRPDAIVLDIQMPGKSGYAIAEELRALYYATRAPLMIAISGKWTQDADRRIAQRVGFDHHFVKPAAPDALVAALAPLSAPSSPLA